MIKEVDVGSWEEERSLQEEKAIQVSVLVSWPRVIHLGEKGFEKPEDLQGWCFWSFLPES